MSKQIEFTLKVTLPEQDLDLIGSGLLEHAIQERLTDVMGHYKPELKMTKIERV